MPRIIICKDCGEEKEHQAKEMCHYCYWRRYRQEHSEEIKARRRKYYAQHRERIKAKSHRYHWENREVCNARSRQYHIEHREEQIARMQRYYNEHREKDNAHSRAYYQQYRNRILAQNREWRNRNRSKMSLYSRRYRARKRNLPDTLTAEEVQQLLDIGAAIYPGEALHLDHIVPVSRGGGTTRANMHAIPAELNMQKHNKMPQDIYKQSLLPGVEDGR